MKQFKKMLLMMTCVCVMLGCVACGNRSANDNTMNDATDTTDMTDDTNDRNDGVVEDLGEDVVDGVEDIGKDVEDAVDGEGTVGNDGAENKVVPKENLNNR